MTTCTTSWRICRRFASALAIAFCACALVAAQTLDPAAMLKPSADSWPTYHGDYSGQRHSRLAQITPDNVRSAHAGVGVSDRSDAADQVVADPRRRRHLHHDARQHLGDRRAIGATVLALHLSDQPGLPHRPSRRGDLQRLGVPDHARRAPGRARRADRQGEVERRDRRRETRLLVDERAADHPQSPAGRRLRRLRQPARHAAVVRSRDRRAPVDVLQHAAGRHAERGERRRDRRADVDDRHLRSRAQPGVRRHRAIRRRC